MAHELVFARGAIDDLKSIFNWVADGAGSEIAEAYDRSIRAACNRLRDFPLQGSHRDDLAPGLRSIAFKRRCVIVYLVEKQQVRIVRVLHRGLDTGREFAAADPSA